jgi:hypothetical protein
MHMLAKPRVRFRTAVYYLLMLLIPLIIMWIGIGYVSYWTIPSVPVSVEGDSYYAFDSEIGYAARPNSSTKWTVFGVDGKVTLQYHAYTDRRGARVVNRGEQTPDHVDVLLIGDSFTWGYGVEGHETFAFKTISALGGNGINLALASYGTVHSLQMLRRNRDLKPKLVIFLFTNDHLWRNVSACARSYYPFCLDVAHLAWDSTGRAYIAAPRSDGVARIQRQVQAEQGRLDPATWVMHGLDVIVSQLRFKAANAVALDLNKQSAALESLIQQMATTTSAMRAVLLIVSLPDVSMAPPPEILPQSAKKFDYRFLNLAEPFMKLGATARSKLYLPNDGHPSQAGHALVAQELIAYIRKEQLLAQ